MRKLLRIAKNFSLVPPGFRADYFKSGFPGGLSCGAPLPWINYNVIEFLLSKNNEGNIVFEYGSGQSSLFWLGQGCELVSVEHDRDFYSRLCQKLKGRCEYVLIPPEPEAGGVEFDPAATRSYHSSDYKGCNFRRYASYIDKFADDYFDVVVVDGRSRPSCIQHAVPKIKAGGMLILDNSDRSYYLENTANLLKDWRREVFTGVVRSMSVVQETSVFIKP